MVLALVLTVLLPGVSLSSVAEASPQIDGTQSIQQLFEEKRWEQVVEEARKIAAPSAETRYYYGVALAQLGRWDEARTVFLAGQRQQPDDARFPVELGGVAFKQKRFAESAKWLRRGMRLNPGDSYTADFLGSVYFLQGNIEAALRHWNRIAKPHIENTRVAPGLRVDSVLLDRAFAFAPGGTLLLSDLLTTRARVRGLGIFSAPNIRLDAQDDGTFHTTFTAVERNGFGGSTLQALVSTFRGIGYQTVFPGYFNLARSAINIDSLVRWDAQKRRLAAALSGPLRRDPRRRYRAGLDLRDENWDLRRSFQEPALRIGSFKLRRNAVSADVSFMRSGGWSGSVGGELSHRDYRNVSAGTPLPQDTLLTGYQLKQAARLDRELWRVPDRRFEISASISSEAATIWASPRRSHERLQISLTARWFPKMAGDDYAVQQQIRAGRVFGKVPFDELFMLGLERDNDLWMRAHIGARDGLKGSAPLGRHYYLSNWEIDKNIYSAGFLSVKLSPFLDVGWMDSSLGLGSRKWFWDTGVQAKFRVLGVGLALIYGKDLRSGRNSFYVADLR